LSNEYDANKEVKMKKNKVKTVLAFTSTLVIFVVSLCVPTLFGQGTLRARQPMMQNQSQERLPALDLTDEQKEQIKNFREDQREMQQQFMEKAKNLNQKLNELKQDPAANAIEIEKIQDAKFNLRIEQMKNGYMHQKETRKVFTPEQLEKMSVIRQRASRGRAMMRKRVPQRSQMRARGQNRGSGQGRITQRNRSRTSQRGKSIIRRRR
jgi:Spy/CpxP family protein refolding chaperone